MKANDGLGRTPPVLRRPSLRELYPRSEEKPEDSPSRSGKRKLAAPQKEIIQRGRKRSVEATIPRNTRTRPPAASIAPTHAKGTPLIANTTLPPNPTQHPHLQF